MFQSQGNKLNDRNKNKILNEIVINKKINGKIKNKKNKNKREMTNAIKKYPSNIKYKITKTNDKSQSSINIIKVKKITKSKDNFSIKIGEASSKIISKIEGRPKNKAVNNKDSTLILETYNDQELNTVECKKALLYDKRTFFQCCYSLLKKTINSFYFFS